MGSKGHLPPPHLRLHPDPYGSAIRPPVGGFPPFEMLPPHEVMEQKLAAQHIEITKLATENQRLASTHGTLRQDLATAKHELQLKHAHIADMKSEKDQQLRSLLDKIEMMESELKAGKPIKAELEQARTEAQSLVATRQELMVKAQQLTRDLQVAHSQAQQLPALMAELDGLRQEYQHCRATYDYEKKLYNDHLESLQVMEKNYTAMSREVGKLRAELSKSANFDPRSAMKNAGGPYGGPAGYNEGAPVGNHVSGPNAYGVGQGQGPVVGGGGGGGLPAGGTGGNSPHVVAQSGRGLPGYNASRLGGYDPHRVQTGPGYDAQRVQTGTSYDPQRGPGYNAAHQGPGYDMQRPPAYDMQRGPGDDVQKGANFDPQKGQVSGNNPPYAASAPNARAGPGYEPALRGGNPVHR